jgi:hypothetical protein
VTVFIDRLVPEAWCTTCGRDCTDNLTAEYMGTGWMEFCRSCHNAGRHLDLTRAIHITQGGNRG